MINPPTVCRMMGACWLALLLAAGCRTVEINPYLVLQVPADQKLYTAFNLWHGHGSISAINYQSGNIIPFGTEIRLERVTEEEVDFTVVPSGQRLKIHYQRQYWVEPVETFLKRLVTTDDATAQARDIPAELLSKMRSGMVVPGMTKAQVLKTFGYPPTHRTPDLQANSWIYWRRRGATVRVFFKDDQVLETHQ